MTKDEALAWADKSTDERLRESRRIGTDGDYEDSMANCIDTLAARVRELEGRTCDRCSYCQFINLDKEAAWCDYVEHFCDTMGNTCGAFREKDPS